MRPTSSRVFAGLFCGRGLSTTGSSRHVHIWVSREGRPGQLHMCLYAELESKSRFGRASQTLESWR
jgi:hypothetical protein